MGSRERERLDSRRRRSRTPGRRHEWSSSVNIRQRHAPTRQERSPIADGRYIGGSSRRRRSFSRSPSRSRSPSPVRTIYHDVNRSRRREHSVSSRPMSQLRTSTYRTSRSNAQHFSPSPERRRSPIRERRLSPSPSQNRAYRHSRSPYRGRNHSQNHSRSASRSRSRSRHHQSVSTIPSRREGPDQSHGGRDRARYEDYAPAHRNTVNERSNVHAAGKHSPTYTARQSIPMTQEREQEYKETKPIVEEKKSITPVKPMYDREVYDKRQTSTSIAVPVSTPAGSERIETSPDPPVHKPLAPVVDPILQKRQEARLVAYRAVWKCESVSNQATLTYLSCEAHLAIAEYWLSLQVKNLEDVGRRMECQDWNFKHLESDGIELSELMKVPQMEDKK